MPRKRMVNFAIHEISGVGSPAQKHARAVIMKRDDAEPISALAAVIGKMAKAALAVSVNDAQGPLQFDDLIEQAADQQRRSKVYDVMWPLFDAMQDSIRSIAGDETLSTAGKAGMIQTSIDQFAQAVKDALPEVDEELSTALKNDPALAAVTKAATAGGGNGKDPAMDAAIAKELADLKTALAAMTKKHDETATALDTVTKAKAAVDDELGVLKAAAEIAKNDESFTANGQTIRKSVVGADSFAFMKAQEDRIQKAEFEKQADSADYARLPGTAVEKGAALRVVAGIADEPTRKSLEAMLKGGNAALASAMKQTSAGGGDPEIAKGEARLEQIAADVLKAEPTLTKEQAYAKATATDEGRKIYNEQNAASRRGRAA